MNDFYLILGSEAALADRALSKISAQLKEEKAEVTTISAGDAIVGDISDALAPSLFSERRALIIKDLQDLPEESRDEITRYLPEPDATTPRQPISHRSPAPGSSPLAQAHATA